jgi:uncharacterized protein YecE (DUF72 family)
MRNQAHDIHLGSCSWKYPSWRGLVYSEKPENYLYEYSRRYDCVEIDQWFYSPIPLTRAGSGWRRSAERKIG